MSLKQSPKRHIEVVGAAIVDGAKVLLVRRGPGEKGAGLWEFPGGKIEPGESPEEALKREVREELSLEVHIVRDLGRIFHSYPELDLHLRVFLCHLEGGTLHLTDHDAFQWLPAEEIELETLLPADKPFVEVLRKL